MAVLTIGLAAVAPVGAAIDEAEPTSYAPLEAVLSGLGLGTPLDGLLTPGEGAIANQFQVMVNLGPNPAFFDDDRIATEPVGLDATGGALVSLIEQLGTDFDETGQMPPLHPDGVVRDGAGALVADVSPLFDGWQAFSESGAHTGSVPAVGAPSLIWGLQLTTPFDTTCATPSSAGRTWESRSAVSGNAPYTAELLDDAFLGPPGSHDALADGTFGRSIELTCQGPSPVLMGHRLNPDLGRVRTFGPLDIYAFVKDDWVVFLTEASTVADGVPDPAFFATGDSGTVELSQTATPVLGLVPNPYDAVTEVAHFVYDLDSIQLISRPSSDGVNQNLLYTGGAETITTGVGCGVGIRVMHAVSSTVFDWFWGTQTSSWRRVTRDGDTITTTATYLDGSSDTITINAVTGDFTARLTPSPGSDQEACIIEGVVTWGDAPPSTPGEDATGTPDDGGDGSDPAPSGTTGGDDGGGSFPVLPIVLVVGAVVVGGTITITRMRRADPDDPEPPGPDHSQAGDLFVQAAAGMAADGTTLGHSPADAAWLALESREFAIQEDIKARQAEVVRAWTTWHGRFTRALSRWADAAHRAWKGAQDTMENQRNWEYRSIAAEALELIWAVKGLVKGVFSIGRGAIGWWRARNVSKLDVTKHLKDHVRAGMQESPELADLYKRLGDKMRDGAKKYTDELDEVGLWAHDAGMPPAELNRVLLDRLDGLRVFEEIRGDKLGDIQIVDELIEAAIPRIAQAKGLAEAPIETVNLVGEMQGVLGTLARGGELSDEAVAAIQRFVRAADDNPEFLETLGTMYTTLNRGDDLAVERVGRGTADLTGEIADLVPASTLENLRNLVESARTVGTDPTALKESLRTAWQARLGPAKATALETSAGQTSLYHSMPTSSTEVHNAATEAAEETIPDDDAPRTGDIGSVGDHMAQFDITTDAWVFSTDSVLVEVLEVFLSPIETGTGAWHSLNALDGVEHLLEEHADDLGEMAQAFSEMRNALEGLDNAVDHGADLLGMIQELRGVQNDMRDAFESAPAEWQAANRAMFDEKMAHIDQKIQAIGELAAAMRKLNADVWEHIQRMRRYEQSHDGDRRSGLEWIDADLMADITRTAFTLEGYAGAFLVN